MLARIISMTNIITGKETNDIDPHSLMFLPEWGLEEGKNFVMSRICSDGKLDTEEIVKSINRIGTTITVITDTHEYLFVEKG